MLTSFEAEYVAGGYPTPTYHGRKYFSMNVSDTDPADVVLDNARARARQIVARASCFDLCMVKITDIRRTD